MKTTKMKLVTVCSNCGSDNVLMKYWVYPNTNEIIDSAVMDESDCYCEDCENNNILDDISHEVNTKVIGFQIVDKTSNNIIHSKMASSFCIYSLSQANVILNSSDWNSNWKLLAIWTNDIENPTMMFKGDPRK